MLDHLGTFLNREEQLTMESSILDWRKEVNECWGTPVCITAGGCEQLWRIEPEAGNDEDLTDILAPKRKQREVCFLESSLGSGVLL